MNPAADWRWPFSWIVKEDQRPPYELWIHWHYHCLLPNPGTRS